MILGPKPKRVDLYITRGIEWSKMLRIKENDVNLAIAPGEFVGKIRKKATDVTAYDFVFTAVDATNVEWSLPAATSLLMPVGCTDSDPASKYLYDIIWARPGNDPVCLMKGFLTLNPKIT